MLVYGFFKNAVKHFQFFQIKAKCSAPGILNVAVFFKIFVNAVTRTNIVARFNSNNCVYCCDFVFFLFFISNNNIKIVFKLRKISFDEISVFFSELSDEEIEEI